MKPEEERVRSGPYHLPILERRDVAYFVDNRLQEFRVVSRSCVRSIDFQSEAGRALLKDCTLAACPSCGCVVAFPEDQTEGDVSCRCGQRVSLQNVLRLCGQEG
jgi:hypothetical protein